MPGETFAQRQQRSLSDRERQAAVLLFEDGWSVAELAMTMCASESAIRRSLRVEGALGRDA
jgi:DNA-directed RNA polymerase specialized sigma24 family protein